MRSLLAAAALLIAGVVSAAPITLPPDGDNQRSTVSQQIGVVTVTIDYHSPDVHAPDGKDRRGAIWGKLVPYGMTDEAFGTCSQCPWRAGANENTTFEVSHDVKIEGQPLPAGKYALFMIAGQDDWTLVLSKNNHSWGAFFYEPGDDQLRVKVKPAKSDYHEWLTYEFTDRHPDHATAALKWEDVEIPWKITVDNMTDLYLAALRQDLRTDIGFQWQNWEQAAQYAIQNKRAAEALEFATGATSFTFVGQENFRTLSTLAEAQELTGKTADAAATREKALNHATATTIDLHQYGRRLQNAGKKEEALRVFELNAKKHPNEWPVNVGLARGYSSVGRYKDALKYAKLAAAQAPDPQNKKFLEDGIKKLEAGKDLNM
jgi:hypothetical protein